MSEPKIEVIDANPMLLVLTEKIVEQNNKILDMNARLLQELANPICIITNKPEAES